MATRLSLIRSVVFRPCFTTGLALSLCELQPIKKRAIRFAALALIVGWVKRDVGTVYVGSADLIVPQQSEIATKLVNPTRLVADCRRRLNPTYDS
jgi:hypothetical protein